MQLTLQNKTSTNDLNFCVIIPTYNNVKTLKSVLNGVLNHAQNAPIIVVNDGSSDGTSSILNEFENKISIITNEVNLGKGISLRKAFKFAWENGYEYAITIDSDGQHYPEDIPLFLETLKKNPGALIMGSRNMAQEGVPGKSSFGNKFSNFWFKIETGITLPDTQTGFRLYPLEPISKTKLFTTKFETEIEVIVKLAWKKVEIIPIPINVLYDPTERVSHFRPFRDFSRISLLNTYLVTLTLLYYLPIRVLNLIKEETLKRDETNLRKSVSIGFGVFMGILPIWGFQLLVGIPLAVLFKLNKVLFISAANISVPPAIPFIIYFSYLMGTPFFENKAPITSWENLTLEAIHINFVQYIVGGALLAFIAGGLFFITTLIFLKIIRKKV